MSIFTTYMCTGFRGGFADARTQIADPKRSVTPLSIIVVGMIGGIITIFIGGMTRHVVMVTVPITIGPYRPAVGY